MKFIDDMRERPEDERLALAAVSAGLVALALFLVWGMLFFRGGDNTAGVEVNEQAASASGGFQGVQENISGAIDEFSVQYQQLQRALDEAKRAPGSQETTSAVELTVDESGDVQVDNIIIKKDELGTKKE
jgi:hypothetical protein